MEWDSSGLHERWITIAVLEYREIEKSGTRILERADYMTVCNCGKAHLIKTDGGLWHGMAHLVPELEKQGWRQVVNPKRHYYPEFDKTHPTYVEKEHIDQVSEEDEDTLKYKAL